MSCTFTGIICKLYCSRRKEEMAEETEGQNMSGHIAIDVLDSEFIYSIRRRLSVTTSSLPLPSNEQPIIYRVPERIRQYDNEAYEPRLVSIGPYHHNKQSLEPMEEHKWRYLQAILDRNSDVRVENYLAKIKALEAQARGSYSESINLNSNDFVQMMLLDGCFIVELFAKYWKDWDDSEDPIYGNGRLLRTVCVDMLLLENQLPYCILQCIFSCVFPYEDADVKLVEAALEFCDCLLWLPFSGHRREVKSYHHLLHLIHCRCSPEPETDSQHLSIKLRRRAIPSAEMLKESGIEFKRKAHQDCVQAVEFNKHGVMEIRSLFIDVFIVGLLRNFLAFEQCYRSAGSYFTIYTAFMDTVIKRKADVEILRDKRILEHACGSDEELALLFSGLTKGSLDDIRNRYLSSLFNNVIDYCDTKRQKWRAKRQKWRASLMRDYFNSPWSVIALIGAIVVIILTAIQSFFSVYAYVRPPHQF